MLREKLFEKKLCTDLDFGTNFWEREQINLRLITNNEISACYIKPIENISPIWTRKLRKTIGNFGKSISLINKDGLIRKNEDSYRIWSSTRVNIRSSSFQYKHLRHF